MKSEWVSADELKVKANGNGLTSPLKLEMMSTLWAAEKAKEGGFSYFAISEALRDDNELPPGRYTHLQIAAAGHPESDIKYKMYKEKPSIQGSKVFDVEQTIAKLEPILKKKK